MTFLQMQDAVLNRLNLTTTEARTRVKVELNQRNLEVTSSLGLAKTRFGIVTAATASGTSTVTVSGVEHIHTVFDPTVLDKPLIEVSLQQIRQWDAPSQVTGTPTHYAIQSNGASTIVLRLYPQPNAVITLSVDAVISGTDLTADGDIPTWPASFHDILVKGALEDEYRKLGKNHASAADTEGAKFEKRITELRYFLAKSSWLVRRAVSPESVVGAGRVWPYSNLG